MERDLACFDRESSKAFQIKTEVLGPDENEVKELRVLNRVIRWESAGITWEADPRHAELIVQHLKLADSKAVVSPGLKDEKVHRDDRSKHVTNVSDGVDGVCSDSFGDAMAWIHGRGDGLQVDSLSGCPCGVRGCVSMAGASGREVQSEIY